MAVLEPIGLRTIEKMPQTPVTVLDGTLLIGNTSTGYFEQATLTGGTDIGIVNTGGTITISSTGGFGDLLSTNNLSDVVSASTSRSNLGLGNVENTALSTWAGTSNITTLGTIATGVWNGTIISAPYGGTNQTTYTAGAMLYAANSSSLNQLAIGSDGEVLTLAGGVPTWAAAGGVSKVGTPVNSQVGVWTGDGTIEGAASLTYDGSNLQLTGDIGSTGTRIAKGWFTDLQVTNAIAGSVTGNAATVSTITGLAPDTATTQATQGAITGLGTLVGLEVTGTDTTTDIMTFTGDSLTTGTLAKFYSNSSDIGLRNLVDIVNDNAGSFQTTCLNLQQDSTIGYAMTITSACGGIQFTGTGSATEFNIISSVSNTQSLQIQADSLTTGRAARFASNSANTSDRNLVEIVNDHTASTQTKCLYLQQDSSDSALEISTGLATGIEYNGAGRGFQITTTTATNALSVTASSMSIPTASIASLYTDSSSTAGFYILKLTNDNTAATGAIPLFTQQDAVVSTNFKIVSEQAGVTTYVSDGTTPNTNLSGTAGDICYNGPSGQPFYCGGGTTWSGM